ncbi:hypothetical protein L6164_029011 [Bauhinia variegata]|nr:hypothetical protein L6164_029011 [Bauhinia variegata]
MKSLKNKNKLDVTVLRGEERQLIAISDLKVGDTVLLKSGDEVPADGLLINGENFEFDPKIDAGSKSFLFSGSKVIEGEGCMVVTSVGNKVYLSEMHSLTAHGPEKKKVLETRIEKPVSYIDYLSICISVIIALVVLIRLICKQDGDNNGLPEIKGKVSVGLLMEILERIFFRPQGKISILTGVLTVAAICFQHGMPLTITLSLKYQTDKVIPDQAADVRDLSTFGTMGLVTVLFIDTSSQLICKLVEVSTVWMGKKDISTEVGSEIVGIPELFQQAVGVSVLAPELSLCPMLNSIVSWAEERDMNIVSFSQNHTIVKHRQPHSVKERFGVLVKKAGDDEQVLHLHWSGAASSILNMCSRYYDSRGECHAMENQKTKFESLIQEMKDSGLRPIAFAYRKTEVNELEQDGLVLLAVIGLKYTFQDETKSAMEDLKNAGIKIILVSEEDIMAVRHIACGLGISENSVVLEEEIEALASTVRLGKVDLRGSFLLKDKLLMVQCLQEEDHVVAVIEGSRTIDAAILEKADVGIVEISRSTTMARDNSGICIKCFSALPLVVRAGRCIYQNVQKFTQLQVTTCASGSLVNLIAAMSIGESPLTAVQLIWVNVAMCFLGGHMMSMKLTGEEQLKPFDSKQSLVTQEIMRNIAVQVFYQVSVFVLLQFEGQRLHNINEARKTMIFNTFMLCQIFNQLHVMQLWKKRVLKAVLHSYTFLLALGACLLLQFLAVHYAEGLVADGMQLNGIQWAICVLFAALSWGFDYTFEFLAACLKTSANSSSGFSNRRRWFYLSYLGIPFLIVLCVHVP